MNEDKTFEEWWNEFNYTDDINIEIVSVNFSSFDDAPEELISIQMKVVGDYQNYTEEINLLPEEVREIADKLYKAAEEVEQ